MGPNLKCPKHGEQNWEEITGRCETQDAPASKLKRLLGQIKPDVKIKTVAPAGMFGANDLDTNLDTFLRVFAEWHKEKGEWAEKYGTHYESEKATMQPFCWCEKDDCPYCFNSNELEPTDEMVAEYGMEEDGDGFITAPNFWYKPLNFKVWWYKYIGRSVHINKELDQRQFNRMVADLLPV